MKLAVLYPEIYPRGDAIVIHRTRQGTRARPSKPTGSPLLFHKPSRQWTVKVKWGTERRTVYLGRDHTEAMRR